MKLPAFGTKPKKGNMTFLKQIIRLTVLAVALLIGFGLSAPTAWADYIVTLSQVGSNVVATGSGTINLTDLSFFGTGGADAGILPSDGEIVTGPTSGSTVDVYTGFTGPTNFGSGGITVASSGSGDTVGITSSGGLLGVPLGYVSGNPLSDTSTYDNQTLASLGVTPGTYTWTWGSGANADSFTLTVAPEPSTLLLLALPLGLLALFGARSRRSCGEATPAHLRDMP